MCILCGADTRDRYFCEKCWKAVPLRAKQRWWEVSDYGKKILDDEQVRKVVDHIREKQT